MDNLVSLFESESNPLKDSMKAVLEQLPNNSDQVKAIFKSLLLVHISKIKDPEERLTWQSLINTLEGLSTQDPATYSFGQMESSQLSKKIRETNVLAELDEKQGSNTRQLKSQNLIPKKANEKERQKALKNAILISLRLRYVESFWIWQMHTGGLDNISFEFYMKNMKQKVFKAWRNYITYYKTKYIKYEKAYKYNDKRTMLVIMMKWAEYIRDQYQEKIKCYISGGNNSDLKRLNYKKPLYKQYRKPDNYCTEESEDSDIVTRDVNANRKKYFTRYSQGKKVSNRADFFNSSKKAELLKIFKGYEEGKKVTVLFDIFFGWKNSVRYRIIGKEVLSLMWRNMAGWGFKGIYMWAIKGPTLNTIKQRYSIDNLSDYELSIKITILEKRLTNLHQHLMTEQITNKALISEKQELMKIYA
ncbi:hypothetical protein SteCoe_6058 [Stentor coeruleus]|uniref:Uncharacterized protein n=1 Tax=Stentor coeruleus TaxID=5963 RepID=A0A1R2CQV0_9CILI|nr:hypothetical protein SteCoe_6058 [Stentor coeruleus]